MRLADRKSISARVRAKIGASFSGCDRLFKRKGRPAILLSVSAVLLSLLLSFALSPTLSAALAQTPTAYGMVDPVAEEHAVGYQVYIERCATCHVALPPAVLPIESWQTLLNDQAHYGVSLPKIPRFDKQLMLNYLQTYARRYQNRGVTPYRLSDSNYFLALHPNVTLPQPLDLRSCTSCHLGAGEQNYTSATESAS